MKDFILWWPRFFKEAWITYKFRRNVKSIEEELEEQANLRVDWIGRVYTVINIKEEFQTQPDLIQQSIVFKELAPANQVLIQYGLSDLAYPTIERLEGSPSFLVTLYPDNEYFRIPSFLLSSVVTTALGFGSYYGINYLLTLI